MKSSAPVALALGAGYLLGRTHKMRWALMLGAVAATGRLDGLKGQLLQQGTKVLQSSPELAKIGESGGRLLDAGKAAALAAVNSRVDSLSGTLQERTESLAGAAGEAKVPGLPGGKKQEPTDRGGGEEPEAELQEEDRGEADESEEDEYDEEEDEYDEEDEEDEEDEDESGEYEEDEESGEEEAKPAKPARSARARSSSQDSGVRKTGRRS